ncbi:SDR family oxidoreductase [Hymenobacter sp. BT770]|uniref:SDR family oxidoreductase n=1 Tax=Hymenobacter sp. BT770 TaxID=2886942 RepID=UPI001D107710|nr:SDR family oxidoreductase [Hymenobacter sp. BT770]MCC3154182.1 SDR family oxidoreductase [Hymenobacter sp. BT770]MDO3414371.1 SDR family oxidoreductase [Hymenobacter sp. BT770]
MIVITGATGHLGHATIEALLAAGVAPTSIVALARTPDKAAALHALGVQVRAGDYNDPASLVAAFQGADKVLLISSSDLEDRTAQHRRAIDAAQQAGVPHLLYTSMLRPSPNSTFAAAASHFETEAYLKASGLTYTIFGVSLYLDLVPMLVGDAAQTGLLYSAVGDGKVAFPLRADIAQALANALTSAGHENKTYDIAPAPAYSMADVAAALGAATGQPVQYVPVSLEDMAAGLRAQHTPEPVVQMLVGMTEAMRNNEFNHPSDTFQQLLGRAPVTLPEHLARVYAQPA